jgi:RIO-like serine/threonine protein kinase
VEVEIMKAFDAIHELGVIHNDVREQNILVTDDGESVFIIDFDHSVTISELTEPQGNCIPTTSERSIALERREIKILLHRLKNPEKSDIEIWNEIDNSESNCLQIPD